MPKDTWYRMDNVAKVFLASYNKRDTRSFRVSCTLKEEIEPELLSEALKNAVQERPQYQVTIHKGLFWHYMEESDIQPEVSEEEDRPCPQLYGIEIKGKLHYKVTYYYNRINLDMFHALSDGNGGVEFLNLIVFNYLKLRYKGKFNSVVTGTGATADSLDEDSFKQFYRKEGGIIPRSTARKRACQIRGLKLPYDQLRFFEIHMPADKLLVLSRQSQASLTSYLGARLMLAIYHDMPLMQRKRPVTISMPVNLRNFYPSLTARNFFNSVYVSHVFSGSETLTELAGEFDAKLKAELTPEMIAERMNNYEKIESILFVRMVPLFIKNPVVNLFNRREDKGITAVISNLGRLKVPDELKEHIETYACYCSTSKLFLTCSSFENDFVIGISSAYRNTAVLRNFLSSLSEDGVPVTLYASEVLT
ncbi:MAG TPA: hypothetical protein DCL38_08130 [Lachnospiraceae bacterium]|nr:hypothetical protein [Lachnospiraceae bacterium]